MAKQEAPKMSTIECPPTPPTLPEGEAAITPPPKQVHKSEDEEKLGNDRSSSPGPSCAICLGALQNVAHTDTCMHKFCFVCLLEWSKVRAVCPLCKSKFKSIIHNIKGDDDYETTVLPEPPPRPHDNAITIDGNHEEARRFRYRTTMPANPNDALALMRLEEIRAQVELWRRELPDVLPPNPTTRISAASQWNRRRGAATSEFRRDIYRRNMYLDPDSVQDIAGRVRECSPAWYRRNPAQTHRLVPWLNRELNALLVGSEHQSCYVTQKILQYIERFNIRSPEFHEKLLPYLGTNTDHFQHEFYHYASSPHDMIAFDRYATYTYQNPTANAAAAASSDEDDILVVNEIVRPAPIPPVALPPVPLPLHIPSVSPPIVMSSPPRSPSLPPRSRPTSPPAHDSWRMDMSGPSTSTGISTNLTRLVIPQSSDTDSDSGREKAAADEVEVVGVVKPRHERTPEIIDVSSDNLENEQAPTTSFSRQLSRQPSGNEMIEISSDSNVEEVGSDPKRSEAANIPSKWQSVFSNERFLQRRIQSCLEEALRKTPSSERLLSLRSREDPRTTPVDQILRSWINIPEVQDQPSVPLIPPLPSLPTPHAPVQQVEDDEPIASTSKGKGKGKGKSSRKVSKEVKKKKSKKRKRSKELSCSSSNENDSDYEQRKKVRKLKRKKAVKKKKKKASKVSNSSSSNEEDREEQPLSRWKVSIKPIKKTASSTDSTSSIAAAAKEPQQPPEHEEDLRLRISRKRPLNTLPSPSISTESEEEMGRDLRLHLSKKRPYKPPVVPSDSDEENDRPQQKMRSLVFKVDSNSK